MFTFAQKRKKGKIPKTWYAKENYSRKVSKYLGGQIHYEKKLTKNIRPTDILQIFSKYCQIY